MGIKSIFGTGKKYFSKSIQPKCDYCQFGKRAKDGNKVLCEKSGLVDCTYSCSRFVYSPLKRIPVKQLKFVGSLADEDIYVESADEKHQKEAEEKLIAEESAKAENTKAETSEKNTSVQPEENNSTDAGAEQKEPETAEV